MFGVMREPRGVDLAVLRGREGVQRLPVELQGHIGRDRVFDSETRDLVAECNRSVLPHEHPGIEAFAQTLEAGSADFFKQPDLGMIRRDGDSIEQRPGRRG